MNDIPLREYAQNKTQDEVARQIGVTQSGLSQMLRSNRRIFVRVDKDGEVIEVYEIRSIGSRHRDRP
ncbi:helix-turn-helix domain-containing protein [Billgrantia azerbaijanica]|nr:helix-turn-helix domain-containing protein [Halomonas azerbaijanica]